MVVQFYQMYRSRLQQTQEKKNKKTAVLLLLGALLLVVLMIIWGIPLLIKLAVFVGDINSSKRPIDKTDLIPPAPPSLSAQYEATNSATQSITGFSEPGVTIYLTKNKKPLGEVVAKDDGGFVFSNLNLEIGRNEFTAVAMDLAGNTSQPSTILGISYSNKEPKLDIESPTEGKIVTGKDNTVEVKGVTDPGVRLLVNDRIVVVTSEGKFATRTTLNEGENTLVFVGTDRSGNSIRKEIKVSYQK